MAIKAEDAALPVSNAKRNYVMVMLVIIYMCNTIDRHAISLLAEPIRADLGLSDMQLGMLSGLAFALFYTFFGIPAGWLADRFGRLRILTICAVIWSAFSAMGGFAANYWQLAVSRMGVGVGEAGGSAPSYSLISSFFPPEKRGNVIGIFHLGSPIGTLVGSVLCAWIATHYGWRAALITISLPGIIFALILWASVKEPPLEKAAQSGVAAEGLWQSVKNYFGNPLLRNLAIAAGLSSFTSFAIGAWLPAFLMRVQGMSLQAMGAYFGFTYAVAFGVGLWGGGYLADRLVKRGLAYYALVPMAGLLLAIPFIIAGLLVQNWAWSLALFAVPIASIGMFLAPAVACVQNVSPAQSRSVYGALFLFVNNLVGGGLGPVYTGQVSDMAAEMGYAPMGMEPLTVGLMACIPILLLASWMQWRNALRLNQMKIL